MVESLTALKGQPVAGIISCISGTALWGRKKQPIFYYVHLFSTWQKLMNFSHTLSLRKLNYKLQFCVFNFGMCWEFCSDSDIKHFMFTGQVVKLMNTS